MSDQGFMTKSWWERFVVTWNENNLSSSLAGLGSIRFIVLDRELLPAVIQWDAHGQACLLVAPAQATLELAATLEVWRDFVGGDVSAVAAVMSGQMHVKGPVRRLLPYASAFKGLASVALHVN